MKKTRVGILGVTGYGGRETLRILKRHPGVEVTRVASSDASIGLSIASVFPEFRGLWDLTVEKNDPAVFMEQCDVMLLSAPNGLAQKVAPAYLEKGMKVIDYSGDFRLKNLSEYEMAYEQKHEAPAWVAKSVYGMPELYKKEIESAQLIANPGCFPTSIILGLTPFFTAGLTTDDRPQSVSITGTSGAGKKASVPLLQAEVEGTVRPYKIGKHQHTPELNQVLSDMAEKPISVTFIPELGPFARGILSTLTLRIKSDVTIDKVIDAFKEFYKKAPFVRILNKGEYPELKNVLHSNFCDIGVHVYPGNVCVVFSAIDNLLKGQAGLAVQNLNIITGQDERTGLL